MADKYAVGGDWGVANGWSLTSGGAAGAGVPAAGEKALLDANSVDMAMGGNSNALSCIDMTGYTGTLSGVFTVNVDNLGGATAILAGNVNDVSFTISGSFEKSGTGIGSVGHPVTITQDAAGAGDETITTDGQTSGYDNLVIDNNGITSLTAQDAPKWASFDLKANGRYAGGAFDHEIGGHLLIDTAANVFTQTGNWTQTAAGNIKDDSYGTRFTLLTLNAAAASVGEIVTKALAGSGSLAMGNYYLNMYATANNFWSFTGSLTTTGGSVEFKMVATVSNATSINAVGVNVIMSAPTGSPFVLTLAERLLCKNLKVYGPVGSSNTLIANGGLTASGLVTLGYAASTRQGKLTLGGSCSLGAGLVCAGTSVANELNLGSTYLSLTGTIDGVNAATGEIVFTSDDARIRGGTLTDVNCTGRLWCQPQTVTDGTGNSSDVLFRPKPDGIGMGIAA